MLPLPDFQSPHTALIMDDLPQPEVPMISRDSPGFTWTREPMVCSVIELIHMLVSVCPDLLTTCLFQMRKTGPLVTSRG